MFEELRLSAMVEQGEYPTRLRLGQLLLQQLFLLLLLLPCLLLQPGSVSRIRLPALTSSFPLAPHQPSGHPQQQIPHQSLSLVQQICVS